MTAAQHAHSAWNLTGWSSTSVRCRDAQTWVSHSTSAARAGQTQLTRSLALEFAPHGVRANAIAVGVVQPGLTHYPTAARASFDHNPQRRLGDVQDVAEAAVYLAGPSGAFITRSVVEVAGGANIWGEYWALGKPEWFQIDEPASSAEADTP